MPDLPLSRALGAVAVAGLLAAAGSGPATADVRVIFASRHTLVAEAVRFEDGMATVDFGGGNELRVPASAIAEIRELDRSAAPDGAADGWRLPEDHAAAGRGLERAIARAAEESGLDPALLAAVIEVESAFDPFAVSPKGAAGLMQLMPGTARELSVEDPFDAEENVAAGARWLRRLLERYDGDLDLALAAYNAGENAVARYGGVPPFPETQRYVELVRERYARLSGSDA
ncbi:MAG: hypothetical protein Kow0062_16980 [Acidobacteriota bacterium]|nr:MAG: lytic transglycosylase domain-containing protein [Acidobacteriota bacterium]